jgi:hypothetical protein
MLQTGQVLFRRLSVNFALVLPFKDSSEAAEPRCSTPSAIKLLDTLADLRRRLARARTSASSVEPLPDSAVFPPSLRRASRGAERVIFAG